MIPETLLYGLIFLILGIASFILYTGSEWDSKDPYLIKPGFLVVGVLSVGISLYLIFTSF